MCCIAVEQRMVRKLVFTNTKAEYYNFTKISVFLSFIRAVQVTDLSLQLLQILLFVFSFWTN